MQTDSRLLGTILKAGKVLDLFNIDHPVWGVSEVSNILSIPKSSAYQLLATLAEIGLLRQTFNNRYQLGWRVISFARVLLESTEFRLEALRAMDELSLMYRKSVYLATLDEDEVVCVTNTGGQLSAADLEERLYIHSSAVGKVLVSGNSWEQITGMLDKQGVKSLTSKTITDSRKFREEINQVKNQGHAFSLEETKPNLCCVAAPIRDEGGQIIASMSLSVPTDYFNCHQRELINSIKSSCAEVSHNLGFVKKNV